MAAFSHQYHPYFLIDPVFFPDITTSIPGFSEEPNTTTTNTTCFSQFYPSHESPMEIPVDVLGVDGSSSLDNGTTVNLSNNEPTMTTKHNTDSSSVDEKLEISEQSTLKVTTPMAKKWKNRDGSSSNSIQPKEEPKEVKKKKKPKSTVKKEEKKISEGISKSGGGYIHVRARRGQATDSHSLAERVRREKISKRMKTLQALVPGCDKITGKALMLDEIIHYVQSLQNQVEFLSMKLASTNPMFYDFGVDLDEFLVAPQENGQLIWDVDEQRQKLVGSIGFSNNLCSFY